MTPRAWRAAVVAALVAAMLPLVAASGSPIRFGPRMKCKPVAKDGRELACVVPLPDHIKVRSANVRILLPAGYARSKRAYPVVYMLHGVGDDETSWTNPTRGDLVPLTSACQAIFVMPDGGSGSTAGWSSDWADKSFQYESYHTTALRYAVASTFRTAGLDKQAIAGMSMGGFGALSYAARHPGSYRAAASYSGVVDTMFGAPVTGEFYDASGQNSVYSTGTPSRRVWGSQAEHPEVWRAHNPYDLAERLAGLPMFLSAGRGLPGGTEGDNPAKALNYPTEAAVRHLNDRLADRLTALGIAFTDGRYDGGYHDWPYWRAAFTASLTTLMRPLRAATPGCGA
ncbi:MAG TPA: alpha/beta hydrolase family protein [Mycobacteriales bacterium]|nr:alpha/beta hydrolase family protein [Mycobacteriales bacterium]